LAKCENFIYFDLIFPPVVEIDLQTTNFLHFWNQRATCNQKMYHVYIGQLQSSRPRGSRQTLKKIDFTSQHSLLRVRRDQFLPNCKKTHPILFNFLPVFPKMSLINLFIYFIFYLLLILQSCFEFLVLYCIRNYHRNNDSIL
jgi:hypothetical protein